MKEHRPNITFNVPRVDAGVVPALGFLAGAKGFEAAAEAVVGTRTAARLAANARAVHEFRLARGQAAIVAARQRARVARSGPAGKLALLGFALADAARAALREKARMKRARRAARRQARRISALMAEIRRAALAARDVRESRRLRRFYVQRVPHPMDVVRWPAWAYRPILPRYDAAEIKRAARALMIGDGLERFGRTVARIARKAVVATLAGLEGCRRPRFDWAAAYARVRAYVLEKERVHKMGVLWAAGAPHFSTNLEEVRAAYKALPPEKRARAERFLATGKDSV